MKKRILLALLCFVLVSSSAFATYYFGDTGLSFTWAPMDPLFKESRAYQYNNNVAFRYIIAPENTDFLASDILVSDSNLNGYKRLPFRDANKGNNTYWNLKAAVNAGLFRFSWEDYLSLEMYLHGGLNTIFGAYGGVDVLGFDGFYGAGASLSVFDIVTLRFGFHHFSGHWGDEALNDFYARNPGDTYSALTEYTRNNSWLLDISIQPVKYFRVLAEFELPQSVGWIRPAAHVPSDTIKNTSEESPDQGKPLSEYIYSQEGLNRNNDSYPSSYKGWRIGVGAELEIPIRTVGLTYLSFDMQFHQDGKINLETLEYEEDRPWDMEYSIALGLSLQEDIRMPEVTVELKYHDGRFPLLNYFFQRTRYFSVGIILTI